MMNDGSDDAIDNRRPCHIYRVMSPSKCEGSCPNARDIHPELVWYNTLVISVKNGLSNLTKEQHGWD